MPKSIRMPKSIEKKEVRDSSRRRLIGKLNCPQCGHKSLTEQKICSKVLQPRTGRFYKCRMVRAVCSNCWKRGVEIIDNTRTTDGDVQSTLAYV